MNGEKKIQTIGYLAHGSAEVNDSAFSPKPTDGTNPRSAKQQAIAKKMDTWCDHLRQRRWTSPTLPPTGINALAHRDNNKSFSDC